MLFPEQYMWLVKLVFVFKIVGTRTAKGCSKNRNRLPLSQYNNY